MKMRSYLDVFILFEEMKGRKKKETEGSKAHLNPVLFLDVAVPFT